MQDIPVTKASSFICVHLCVSAARSCFVAVLALASAVVCDIAKNLPRPIFSIHRARCDAKRSLPSLAGEELEMGAWEKAGERGAVSAGAN